MEPTLQSEMSVVARILRVFYAPSETFEAVSEQRSAADWLVPTALVAVVATIAALLVLPIVTEGGQEAMQQMKDMPAEEREMVERFPVPRRGPDRDPDRHADCDVHLSLHYRCALLSVGQVGRRHALLRPSPSHNGLRWVGHPSPTSSRCAAHFG